MDLFSECRSFLFKLLSLDRTKKSLLFIFLENHDAVYIVGSLEETHLIRGMRYHPIDIENTVMRTHKRICEW
jgi:hypothetical protein